MASKDKALGWPTAIPIAMATVASTTFQYSPHNQGDAMTQKGAFEARRGAATQSAPSYDEKLLDAKLEAVEARTDTKFAQLIGEVKALGVSLTGINSAISDLRGEVSTLETKSDNTKVIIISTAVASVLAIVALTFTMIAYGQSVADTLVSTFVAGQEASNGRPSGSAQKGPAG